MPFDNSIGDDIEAKALTYALDKVDIYSNSWGPTSQTNTLYGDAGPLMKRALELGVHTVSHHLKLIYRIVMSELIKSVRATCDLHTCMLFVNLLLHGN